MSIKQVGIDELRSLLRKATSAAIIPTIKAAGALVIRIISPYPVAPAKKPDRWYQRGYGPKWRLKNGKVRGRKLSQNLGRKWRISSRGKYTLLVRNNATYSGYVHDIEEQAKIHQATGWKTDRDVFDALDRDKTIEDVFFTALQKELGS